MLYDILSKNDIPVSQMHIYLKNKTGNDGGLYPEMFNDLSISESINGLYTFAIACVITENFTNMSRFLKDYPSPEVATLALIQYVKGMATTIQLKNPCVNKSYENLVNINQLGVSPTLLNLDGDLIYRHYDNTKYFSKEAADSAEDSFPYWVIQIVKDITTTEEIIEPKTSLYRLPYYVQNISGEKIPILNTPGKITQDNVIGYLPPTGIEAILDIENGHGVLASSENAYIILSDNLQPCKHVVSEDELNHNCGTLKLPDHEFDVICKEGSILYGAYGTNTHYNQSFKHTYMGGDRIHIKGLFRNYGVVEDGVYIPLHSNSVTVVVKPAADHTKKDNIPENSKVLDVNIKYPFEKCAYLVIIQMSNEEMAIEALKKIMAKSPYKDGYIDVDVDGKVTIVVYGDNDTSNVNKVKKKILSVFGYKALVINYDKFYPSLKMVNN